MKAQSPPVFPPAGWPREPWEETPSLPYAHADYLLETLPWGIVLLDSAGTVLHLNQQAAWWWGLPPTAVRGQPLALVAPTHLPQPLYEALRQIAAGEVLAPSEFFLPHAGQWVAMASRPQPGQVVVYWQDITSQKHAIHEVQRLEAQNLTLKLDQQKELLLAVLHGQEEERRRIAESLHNGLGQLLFAAKLQLDKLDTPLLHAPPNLSEVRHQADRLLVEAIAQVRTISHQLVPAHLEKVGLATALRDICRDFTTPSLHLSCHVWLEEPPLPQALQITLYRLAQELAQNIVKHAEASEALLELEILPDWVVLRAEDNGRGFDPQTAPADLGLRTLRNAVALLAGEVTIDSSPEYGTHLRLRLPFTPPV